LLSFFPSLPFDISAGAFDYGTVLAAAIMNPLALSQNCLYFSMIPSLLLFFAYEPGII